MRVAEGHGCDRSNHVTVLCIRTCSVVFITKNVELPLGLLLCVY